MDLIEKIEQWGTALTVEDLANLLNASPKTIYKQIKRGKLPAFRIGSLLRLNPEAVARWLRARAHN
jgi:excisionase family DNA binding protein